MPSMTTGHIIRTLLCDLHLPILPSQAFDPHKFQSLKIFTRSNTPIPL